MPKKDEGITFGEPTRKDRDWSTIIRMLTEIGGADFTLKEKGTRLEIHINGDMGLSLVLTRDGNWCLE